MDDLSGWAITGIIFLVLLVLAIIVLCFAFWIWMLVDSIKRNYKEDSMRIVWVLVIIFTGIIGAIIYYFVEKRKDKKRR